MQDMSIHVLGVSLHGSVLCLQDEFIQHITLNEPVVKPKRKKLYIRKAFTTPKTSIQYPYGTQNILRHPTKTPIRGRSG